MRNSDKLSYNAGKVVLFQHWCKGAIAIALIGFLLLVLPGSNSAHAGSMQGITGIWYQTPLPNCPQCPHSYAEFRSNGIYIGGWFEKGRWHLAPQASKWTVQDADHIKIASNNGVSDISFPGAGKLTMDGLQFQRTLPEYAHGKTPPGFHGQAPKDTEQVMRELEGTWWTKEPSGPVMSMTFNRGKATTKTYAGSKVIKSQTQNYTVSKPMEITWGDGSINGLTVKPGKLEIDYTSTSEYWKRTKPQ